MVRWWKKRVPQDEDASLTMDPSVAWGVWAARRARPADDRPPSPAILIVLLGVPTILIVASLVWFLLRKFGVVAPDTPLPIMGSPRLRSSRWPSPF